MVLEFILTMVLTAAILAGLIYLLIDKGPAFKLRKKFIGMGVLVGKSKNQITSVVGLPQSISRVNGLNVNHIATWNRFSHLQRNCYDITLSFDDDNICVGIVSEHYFYI